MQLTAEYRGDRWIRCWQCWSKKNPTYSSEDEKRIILWNKNKRMIIIRMNKRRGSHSGQGGLAWSSSFLVPAYAVHLVVRHKNVTVKISSHSAVICLLNKLHTTLRPQPGLFVTYWNGWHRWIFYLEGSVYSFGHCFRWLPKTCRMISVLFVSKKVRYFGRRPKELRKVLQKTWTIV